MNDIISEFKTSINVLKFNKLLMQAAKSANQEVKVFIENMILKKFEEVSHHLPKTFEEAMPMYKNAVGQEIWDDVKNNPSLPEMIRDWKNSEINKVFPKLIEIIKDALPADHDMKDNDIETVVNSLINRKV